MESKLYIIMPGFAQTKRVSEKGKTKRKKQTRKTSAFKGPKESFQNTTAIPTT